MLVTFRTQSLSFRKVSGSSTSGKRVWRTRRSGTRKQAWALEAPGIQVQRRSQGVGEPPPQPSLPDLVSSESDY